MPRLPLVVSKQGANPLAIGRVGRGAAGIRTEQTPDPQVNSLQQTLIEATGGSRTSMIVDGNLFTDLAFTAMTPVPISHRLNRRVKGYIIVKCDHYARFRIEAQPPVFDTRRVTISADATCTASVWVF